MKTNLKSIMAIILVMVMVLSLAGCGKSAPEQEEKNWGVTQNQLQQIQKRRMIRKTTHQMVAR